MSDHNFWLSDSQFARLQPLLPNKPRGVPRVDDRRVISGIIHVIRHGLMWRDAPGRYSPHKTLYNRFIRRSQIGVFDRISETLAAESQATDTVMIDATHLKAHRTTASLLKKGLFPTASGVPVTHYQHVVPELHGFEGHLEFSAAC
jgi:transposase